MPKVLRIINRFNLGGPTYNAAYLTKYMAPEYETLLIGGQQDKTEANSQFILKNLNLEAEIIPEMRRSVNFVDDLKALRKIKGIIRVFKPDIVHTHASKAGALGRRAAAQMNVPVIIHTFHGHVFDSYFSGTRSKFYQIVERRLAKMSTQIIALSEIQKNDLVNKYKICPADKVKIIPLGFDLNRFRENIEIKRAEFRKEYLIQDDEIAIGIIGRIVPIKNHELFLQGIHYLKQHSTKKIRAFIIGDGEDRSIIEIKARELGLDMVDFTKEKRPATLSFTSWLKDIDKVNAGMDIISLTSLNEGTPVSLIEAQASGKPIVTTRVGGIENIVIPNETALLSDIDDIEGFGKNLLKLAEDKIMRTAFCAKGWPFVSQRFHYTRLVDEMKDLYNKLLSEKL
jgi:glycosyltransferase involved in cell wall biosynthesis